MSERRRNKRDTEKAARELEPLSSIAAGLRRPVEAPGLWDRIEQDLGRFRQTPAALALARRTRIRRIAVSLAAAVWVAGVTILFATLDDLRPAQVIMEEDESAAMDAEQRRIEEELARVEPIFRKRIAEENGAASLVAGQVEYLDSNIEMCRLAHEANRLNRGVRRSLIDCSKKKMEIIHQYLARDH